MSALRAPASLPLPVAFTSAPLDRAAELRHDPRQVADLLRRPEAVVVSASGEGVLVERGGARLVRRAPRGGEAPLLLGLEGGRPVFAADLDGLSGEAAGGEAAGGEAAASEAAASEAQVVSLREVGASMPAAESGLAAYLVALLGWHRRHRYCANCGAPTAVAEAGLSRRCPECGATHFPRTDPVVIMTVEHDGQLLLGRRAGWPEGRYSILAGFVAPGETPEDAVVREVQEESGIRAHDPRYVAAQPWPFPASLMLGYEARSPGGTPRVGDGELADVGWFTRAQVSAARAGSGPLQLPPPVSIARVLIERWLAPGAGARARTAALPDGR